MLLQSLYKCGTLFPLWRKSINYRCLKIQLSEIYIVWGMKCVGSLEYYTRRNSVTCTDTQNKWILKSRYLQWAGHVQPHTRTGFWNLGTAVSYTRTVTQTNWILKSRCVQWAGHVQPHRRTGFWNLGASVGWICTATQKNWIFKSRYCSELHTHGHTDELDIEI
jgi:hypothetical protein